VARTREYRACRDANNGCDAAKAINEIIAILKSQHDFWPNSQGWAPSNAIIRLERARLDRSLSFAHTLQNYFAPFPKGSGDAQQILGYATLRSLCEGAIQLFITVYYNDYLSDNDVIKSKRKSVETTVEPEDAFLDPLITFYLKKGDNKFGPYLTRVKMRGNAVHHFKDRDIGTQAELKADILAFRDFLWSINLQLPYPDSPLRDDDDSSWRYDE
jgi:hypothetical protein